MHSCLQAFITWYWTTNTDSASTNSTSNTASVSPTEQITKHSHSRPTHVQRIDWSSLSVEEKNITRSYGWHDIMYSLCADTNNKNPKKPVWKYAFFSYSMPWKKTHCRVLSERLSQNSPPPPPLTVHKGFYKSPHGPLPSRSNVWKTYFMTTWMDSLWSPVELVSLSCRTTWCWYLMGEHCLLIFAFKIPTSSVGKNSYWSYGFQSLL